MHASAEATQPRRLPWWASLLAALCGGLLLDAAGPGLGWWPLALPAVALILLSSWHQRARWGLLVGAIAGLAFWGPHISWLTLYLGLVPWAGLTGVMAAWFALCGMLLAFATRGLARAPWVAARPARLALAQSLTVGGLWVLREGVQSSWPYGGFAWGRLAHTQATGWFAESVSWLGFAGLSGLLAAAVAVAVAVWLVPGATSRLRVIGAAGIAATLALLAIVPVATLPHDGTLRIAAIQGNSKSGIFDDRENGDVFRDHAEETTRLLDELEAAGESVDLIVWPENSAEYDLPGNALRDFQVAGLAKRAGAPIVAGSILQDPDGSYTNSAIVWDADGATGQRYDKRFPVPFAEYMPNREFFHFFAPDLVDLVQLEYSAGQRPAVMEIDTPAGPIAAGLAICFDIIFDQQAEEMVDGGAQVILAPTNNADFGRTDESVQQLQIARLRAIETGRALVNISTVGTSAVVAPDGSALDSLTPFTSDALVAEVPLVAGATPALRFGGAIAGGWMLLGALGCAGAAWGAWNARSTRDSYAPRRARSS
ncbi:apolipoprotein N-acyltransferase [Leucobacter luti]|uniref:Apolipoprotein N-acyltransferase n=2 Tax=Leucobacter luti TaxID=340320 RepID=A0A4V2FNE9_9MICO|nr:apolipoprotein N-acyltransferase [Leucobacter luti]MBL3700238.1 apolipoprotein N-acyltransferase [Leucobacter luti]RZT61039.1 apolipoprotein N-acyltransferase [Leucobacter luti]